MGRPGSTRIQCHLANGSLAAQSRIAPHYGGGSVELAGYDAALPGWQASDVIASPYAVRDYVPDPRIGTWAALDGVRKKLRSRGIALLLDFVGNHTALDHPWTREHPEFYIQGTQQQAEQNPSAFYRIETPKGAVFLALAKDPYFPPWKEVAQLNHFNPAMRAAQIADLRTISGHCDGLRCDMAMLLLNDIFANTWAPFLEGVKRPEKEFWSEAHAALPNLALLAEAYWGTEGRLLDLGFTFSYDKALYDAVRDANPWGVRGCLSASPDYQSHMARFLENHDENRCAAVFPYNRLIAAGTLMHTLPGMRFYYQGELEGNQIRLPITLRIPAPEAPNPMSVAFFHKILKITNEDVFHSGRWSLLPIVSEGDDTSGNFAVYEWRSEKAWKIVAVNVADWGSQGRILLRDRVPPTGRFDFYDQLNDVHYERSGEELHNVGLFVRRDPFGAHLFDITQI